MNLLFLTSHNQNPVYINIFPVAGSLHICQKRVIASHPSIQTSLQGKTSQHLRTILTTKKDMLKTKNENMKELCNYMQQKLRPWGPRCSWTTHGIHHFQSRPSTAISSRLLLAISVALYKGFITYTAQVKLSHGRSSRQILPSCTSLSTHATLH